MPTKKVLEMQSLTYSLQVCELSAEVSQERHQTPIIDGNQQDDAQCVEYSQAGCRNGEASSKHASVHGSALLYEEAAHLQCPFEAQHATSR